MKKIQIASVLLLVAVAFTNCKKTGDTGPAGATGAAGPAITGNLQGYVSLWDQYGARILTGQAGDTVTVVGTTIRAYTDSTGYYIIPNLKTGVYALAINKGGYGNMMVPNFQFTGGGSYDVNTQLSQFPTTVVPAISDSVGTVSSTIVVYTTLPSTVLETRTFILYVGTTAATSANAATYLTYYTKTVNANATKLTFALAQQDLIDAGFTAGQTVYFAAYGLGGKTTASTFLDYTNQGRSVFTAISTPAATGSIVFP